MRPQPWHDEAESLLIHGVDKAGGRLFFPSYAQVADAVGVTKRTIATFATNIHAQDRRVEFLMSHNAQQRRTIYLLESTLRDELADISDQDIDRLTNRVIWRGLVRAFVQLADTDTPAANSLLTKILSIAARRRTEPAGAGSTDDLTTLLTHAKKIDNSFDSESAGIISTAQH